MRYHSAEAMVILYFWYYVKYKTGIRIQRDRKQAVQTHKQTEAEYPRVPRRAAGLRGLYLPCANPRAELSPIAPLSLLLLHLVSYLIHSLPDLWSHRCLPIALCPTFLVLSVRPICPITIYYSHIIDAGFY